jgi:hypothetical protein
MSDLENLRHSFRPEIITTLFVGESPPNGGTFFYKGDSLLHHQMKESFSSIGNFLSEFKGERLLPRRPGSVPHQPDQTQEGAGQASSERRVIARAANFRLPTGRSCISHVRH